MKFFKNLSAQPDVEDEIIIGYKEELSTDSHYIGEPQETKKSIRNEKITWVDNINVELIKSDQYPYNIDFSTQ